MKKIVYACVCAAVICCVFKFLNAKQIDHIVTEVINESGDTIYVDKVVDGKFETDTVFVRPRSRTNLGNKGMLTAGESLYFSIGDHPRTRPLDYAEIPTSLPYKYKITAKPYTQALSKMVGKGIVPGQPYLTAEEVK
jgi:hypothetical protein